MERVKNIQDCTRIDKPWGFEIHWANCDSYVGKILSIAPHHRLSLQYHVKKEETIYVMSGVLILWESDQEDAGKMLGPGSVYHVKPNQIHRFGAGNQPVMLMEVSSPEIDDVVRIKDDYKRD